MKFILLLRIHHWIKNCLIFVPLLVSGGKVTMLDLINTVIASFAFCLLSSIIYIINDIRDIETDRLIERKKNSPLVSGSISIRAAILAAVIIFAFLLIYISLWYFCFKNGITIRQKIIVIAVLASYGILNVGYSSGLKNIPIIDVSIIACGFILRFLLGVTIIDQVSTVWFYLLILAGSYYMGFGKRRNEIGNTFGTLTPAAPSNSRKVLRFYSFSFLDNNIYVCQTLFVVFYTLWCRDPVTVERLHTNNLVWTIPIVLLIFLKYSLDIEKHDEGDPVSVLLKDKALIALCLVYLSALCVIIFLTA
jgi:4-hydroxybenzoate polyprenyltransferase